MSIDRWVGDLAASAANVIPESIVHKTKRASNKEVCEDIFIYFFVTYIYMKNDDCHLDVANCHFDGTLSRRPFKEHLMT